VRVSGRALKLGAYASTWIIWGSTYLAIRWAVAALPPLGLVGVRSLTAGLILLAWARMRSPQAPTRAQWRAAAVTGALYFLIGHGALFWAEQHVASGPAALMFATEHFWVVLLAWALPGGRAPSPRAAVGIVLGLAGVALLSLGREGGIDPLGAAALIVSAGAWAIGALYFKAPRRPASPLYASAMPLVTGGLMLLVASAATGEPGRVRAEDFTPIAIGSLLYLIVFGSIIAFTAFTWLIETEGASRALSSAYVNPFVAVVLGWALGGEALTARMLVAGAAIVLAVVLIVSGSQAQPTSAASAASSQPRRPRRARRMVKA
jgi:drug/metabolite transporter (DMT)-like permease